jgi:class 3 adenylate cyclase
LRRTHEGAILPPQLSLQPRNRESGEAGVNVATWLSHLGLEQYEQAFRENDVDVEVLRELTADDLIGLGVVSIGHRRKLLAAIAALRAEAGDTNAETGTLAERRQLTVMFCDLVGSTSISAKLDAEEWRDLVRSYFDAASEAVTEMGGHVAKELGDGLMALFGYPVAQENDAERAARAALSIQRASAEVNRKNAAAGKPALNARIGIEIGRRDLRRCA